MPNFGYNAACWVYSAIRLTSKEGSKDFRRSRRNMKKIFAIMIAVAALGVAMTGCKKDEAAAETGGTTPAAETGGEAK